MFGIFVLCSAVSWASQNAVVTTDGAIVYKQANFDSPILGYFRSGQAIRISNKTFGPFYRVKFKQGLVGYISDIDVTPQGSGKISKPGSKKTTVLTSTSSTINKSYVGLAVSMVNWSELVKVGGPSQQFSDNLIFYGAKGSFPMGSWLSGPFTLDTTALINFKTPSYFAAYNPSTMIAIGSVGINYTMGEYYHRKVPFYVGASLSVTYESIKLTAGQSYDLTEILLGGALTAGTGYVFSKMIFKLEASYYITKSTYLGVLGALQWQM